MRRSALGLLGPSRGLPPFLLSDLKRRSSRNTANFLSFVVLVCVFLVPVPPLIEEPNVML